MHKPEILAPAGSFDALRAAVWGKADAVYLGTQSFNARARAQNFSAEELARAIEFAHRAGVRVYVTVNTLIRQDELPEAMELLFGLYNLGVDAVIIQDLGLARAARRYLPALELHASTQCTVSSLESARTMAELGFARVVLARELSLGQISAISQAGVIPVEIFLHGALCAAYSGQCLYSSLAGGRSGNRGQCAQSCRLPARLQVSGRSGYIQSTRDLNLLAHLPKLLGLNAAAWKIEGRARSADYVAEVVSIYRRALDQCLANPLAYRPQPEEEERLAQAFNRKFTPGLILGGRASRFYNRERPNNHGLVAGRVRGLQGREALVELSRDLARGDLVEFAAGGGEQLLRADGAKGSTLRIGAPGEQAPAVGETLLRLHDNRRAAVLREGYQRHEPPLQGITMFLEGAVGAPLCLTAEAGGQKIRVCSDQVASAALSRPLTAADVSRQLAKLGESSVFYATGISCDLAGDIHFPVAGLNDLRRRAVVGLTRLLWGQPCPQPMVAYSAPATQDTGKADSRLGAVVADAAEAKAAARAGADWLVLGGEWCETPLAERLILYSSLRGEVDRPLVLRLPRIMHTEEEEEVLAAVEPDWEVMSSSPGMLRRASEMGITVRADSGLNVFNCESAASLSPRSVTLSSELNRGQVAMMLGCLHSEAELVVHGRQLLMVHENCLLEDGTCSRTRGCHRRDTLIDRKGYAMPVHTDYRCRSYLLNGPVLCLVDSMDEVLRLAVPRLRLELAGAGVESVFGTVQAYREAISRKGAHAGDLRRNMQDLWGGLTRGHWERGVD